jgi:cell fate regulator YaaT (PSP1 superfamily)
MAELYLIEYKGHRRHYCSNIYHHKLERNGSVITETDSGEDFGHVLHRWDDEKPPRQKGTPPKILRKATEDDVTKYSDLRPRELTAKAQARSIARRLGLQMKLSDVEIQFDASKMTFYYTAEGRVDFRQMVKELAGVFRTWIEMRQISPREETKRVGDCGMCGGEVCCRRANMASIQIATQDARDQDLQMNMSKLTGLCGKLRCCLSFEKSQYLETKKLFPGRGAKVDTPAGRGVIQKVDVFKDEAVVRLEDGERVRVGPDQIRRAARRYENQQQRADHQSPESGAAESVDALTAVAETNESSVTAESSTAAEPNQQSTEDSVNKNVGQDETDKDGSTSN